MNFVFLSIAVVIAPLVMLHLGMGKKESTVMMLLGVFLFIAAIISNSVFNKQDFEQLLLFKEFSFSTRLIFISYGCVITSLIIYFVKSWKK